MIEFLVPCSLHFWFDQVLSKSFEVMDYQVLEASDGGVLAADTDRRATKILGVLGALEAEHWIVFQQLLVFNVSNFAVIGISVGMEILFSEDGILLNFSYADA